ncbi:MAG: TonB-dependent receptor [Holophagaceae bacterium]
MNRITSRLGLTAIALVSGSALFSQSTTTGSVSGSVVGPNGRAVAGATVKLTSGQISRTALTDAAGTFRFGLLNVGNWSVQVSADSYQNSNASVLVTTNENQALTLRLASVGSATVAVSSSAAVVDFTTNQVGLNISMENLTAVPKGRDFNDLVQLSPGVTNSGALGGPSISGASSLENSYFIDGVSTQDMRKGFQGGSLPVDFIDQVEVQTGAFKPEFSALGGVFSVVTKSGTNQFQGSAWVNSDLYQRQAVAKKNAAAQQGNPFERNDYGATVSGALIPDQLFYFIGVNQTKTDRPGSTNLINLTSGNTTGEDTNLYAKVNYYLTSDQQLTATLQNRESTTSQPTAYPYSGDANWGYSSKFKTENYGLSYDWNISSNVQLSVKAGQTTFSTAVTPVDLANNLVNDTMRAQYIGLTAGSSFYRGGYGVYERLNENVTTQYRADLSWFSGNHNYKIGISSMEAEYTLDDSASGASAQFFNGPGVLSTKSLPYTVVIRRASSGAFNGIYRQWYYNEKSTIKAKYMATYLQDTWEMSPGLRLSYGGRFESQELINNAGVTALKFDDLQDLFQPRVGLTWDPYNTGQTKLSINYAKYFVAVPMQPIMRTGGTEIYVRNYYTAGNTSYNSTTGAYSINVPTNVRANVSTIVDYGIYFTAPPLADGTQLTSRVEWVMGIDHIFKGGTFDGWTVGAKYINRKLRNPIEDSVLDEDYAGYSILWNPKPGAVSYTPSPFLDDAGNPRLSNGKIRFTAAENLFKEAYNDYDAFVVTGEKKSGAWYFNGSYTWSKLFGTYEGLGQSSNGQADALITSTFDHWPYVGEGLLPIDRTHIVKVFGSYTVDVFGNPLTIGLSGVMQYGTPKSLFDNGTASGNPGLDIGGYGNAVPKFGQYGSEGRTPRNATFDMLLDYSYQYMGYRISPNVTIFNLFNRRSATTTNIYGTTSSGQPNPFYGFETGWNTGRSVRVGVKVQF